MTRGLSTRFPDRVLSHPDQRGRHRRRRRRPGAGRRHGAIVEIMFGDFVALAFDQILNFAGQVRHHVRPARCRCAWSCAAPPAAAAATGRRTARACRSTSSACPACRCSRCRRSTTTGRGARRHAGRGRAVRCSSRTRSSTPAGCTATASSTTCSGTTWSARTRRGPGLCVDDPGAGRLRAHRARRAGRPGRSRRCGRCCSSDEIVCQLLVPSRLYPFDLEPLLPPMLPGPGGLRGGGEHRRRHLGREVAHLVHQRLWGPPAPARCGWCTRPTR